MSTPRDTLIAELAELLDADGKTICVSDAATEADLRALIRFEQRALEDRLGVKREQYFASGAKKQGVLGGNRVQLLPGGGISVRKQYDPRRTA